MPTHDLNTLDGLRVACDAARSAIGAQWLDELVTTIRRVRDADEVERATRSFQEFLWEDNHIAATGQGQISVAEALDHEPFRRWLAARSMEPLPDGRGARAAFLLALFEEITGRLAPLLTRHKVPRLKIFRVLCALYPDAMTTIASRTALKELAEAMRIDVGDSVTRQVFVRARFDEALGAVGPDVRHLAERITLPWVVLVEIVRPKDVELATTVSQPAPPSGTLQPLPASRRRRGLTGIKGMFPGLLGALDFLKNGATRAEFLEFLKTVSPDAKQNALGVSIYSYTSEFGAIQQQGNQLVLTDAGRRTLESQDPTPLADYLLTKVLGPDIVLTMLRDRGSVQSAELIDELQRANPGWTSKVVPTAMTGWLRSMGVIELDEDEFKLTERGRAWADRITWTPERLPAEPQADTDDVPIPVGSVELPPLVRIVDSVQKRGTFAASRIASLHSGLWANAVRHFAILTGLSGAGKTLLARAYAHALTGGAAGRLMTLPVQPGWYDPGPLLGYPNPLRPESYVRTDFLLFLMNAAADPGRPYVVVLDEMNLSHPEQYMAPLLSAMETEEPIRLHAADDSLEGVPASIPFPRNLAVIGTVNMDETTHGLSDKVLDRGFVLEFWDVDLEAYPRWGSRGLDDGDEQRARQLLAALLKELAPARMHFGWRVVDDVLDFLAHSTAGGIVGSADALDAAIYAKVLPKLRGEDAQAFRAALEGSGAALKEAGLLSCARKVGELASELRTTGSARFWR